MQAQTDQQTVLPSYEQAVRNPTSSEFQSATAPPMNYEGSYPRQTLYPVQAPYPTQQQQLYQVTQQQQQRPYPTQPQQSYPTQPQLYPTQQPLYPPQQPPYPTQQQQQPYPTQPMPNYSAGRVIAPGSATAAGPTIHVIRHVSTGNTGCSGKRGVWLGILLGLLILAGLLRAAYD